MPPNLGGEDAGHCAKSEGIGKGTACLPKPAAVTAARKWRTHRSEEEVAHVRETCRRLRHMGRHNEADSFEALIQVSAVTLGTQSAISRSELP